jgi:hypothetical protein
MRLIIEDLIALAEAEGASEPLVQGLRDDLARLADE